MKSNKYTVVFLNIMLVILYGFLFCIHYRDKDFFCAGLILSLFVVDLILKFIEKFFSEKCPEILKTILKVVYPVQYLIYFCSSPYILTSINFLFLKSIFSKKD